MRDARADTAIILCTSDTSTGGAALMYQYTTPTVSFLGTAAN